MKVKTLALTGVLLGVAAALSALEGLLPQLPFLPPNFRLGLANIVTMYCALKGSYAQALAISALKPVFVLLMRGPMAASLSFGGGMLSIIVMILLICIFKERISYLGVSISGALAHNLGQFAVLFLILDMGLFIYYLPVMLVTGVIMGTLTGTLLKTVMPALKRL